MNRLMTTLVLTLALSVSVFAGEIPSVPGPPPPATVEAPNDGDIPSVPGEIPTGGFAQQISDGIVLTIFSMFAR